jgi:isocitrate dehydrogenase kinase/phosphatase
LGEQGLPDTDMTLAQRCARVIVDEFAYYNREFRAISRRAPERFENRDWAGTQRDVVERLDLYTECVNRAIDDLTRRLGERVHDVPLWRLIKESFAGQIATLADPEFLKTYFSSITRRMFSTVGVNTAVEFFVLDLDPLRGITSQVVSNT